MNLEDQVTSLALSNRLKELGVKQESIFYWIRAETSPTIEAYGLTYFMNIYKAFKETYSAFTVAELGKILINPENYTILYYKNNDENFCAIGNGPNELTKFNDKNEANVRAQMLIYLIENDLLEKGKQS